MFGLSRGAAKGVGKILVKTLMLSSLRNCYSSVYISFIFCIMELITDVEFFFCVFFFATPNSA